MNVNNHPLYETWANMIQRCTNPNRKDYKNYGARGIIVCDRWRSVKPRTSGFLAFVADMGERPPNKSLDRVNNDGNYEPSNCRWATRREQILNSRADILIAVRAHADKKRAQTHCKRGHLLSGDNLYFKNNMRYCRTCRRAIDKYLYYKKQFPIETYL